MKIDVWHDASGTILAVGRPLDDRRGVVPAGGHRVLTTDYDGDAARLHENYFVDVTAGALRTAPKAKEVPAL